MTITSVSHTPELLTIDWSDGRRSELDAMWLRDHCQMPESRDPANGQRLLNITDIPLETSIRSVDWDQDGVAVDFNPEDHRSVFPATWLLEHCYCLNRQQDNRSETGKTLWQKSDFESGLNWHDYQEYRTSATVKKQALAEVDQLGFTLLSNVPAEPGKVLDVIETFGFVRETNYGRLFEVRAEVNAINLAYTNLGLGCHLDNPYRDPVPGLQLLHCLESSTEGGESVLQDGFRAASILRQEHPESFDVLTGQWINYRFQSQDADLLSRVPMIEVNDLGEVIKVRYNNRSIDALRVPRDKVASFYQAYRRFAEILEREELQIEFRLDPGDLILFDNTRVLHARRAYSQGGQRHLQGAYSDLDGLYSTLYTLKKSA